MISDIKIPVQIKKVRNPDGTEGLKATVPMNIIFEKKFDADWLTQEISKVEKRYFSLLNELKRLLDQLRSYKQKNGRVLLYWNIGDKILKFIKEYERSPLFLEDLTKSLRRDLGISDKMILRCKKFRNLYPEIKRIDPEKSFNSYVAIFEKGYISKKKQRRKTK